MRRRAHGGITTTLMIFRIAVAAMILVTSLWACSGVPPHRPDLILITVDTLRADRLGLAGYPRGTTPHIDAFFADGAIYERSYSTSAHTSPSVVSLLTGLQPRGHGVRLLYQLVGQDIPLVPDLLPPDYQTAAFVSNTVLTDEALGIASRFGHYDDFVDEREPARLIFERGASRTTDAVLDWIRTKAKPARPLFLWVHYIDPHGPYAPPEAWRDRFRRDEQRPIDPDRVPNSQREPGVTDGFEYAARYDAEIGYLDEQVGRLLAGLAEQRGAEDALVLLTADHGESMMEHDAWFTHGYHVYEEIVRVPLMLRGPGVERGVHDVPVSGVDITPTLLLAAGVSPPPGTSGVDLRLPGKIPEDRIILASGGGRKQHWMAAIRDHDKAMILVDPTGNVRASRRYDLAKDPLELEALPVESNDRLVRQLRELAASDPDPGGLPREFSGGSALPGPKVAPRISAEAAERLRALGYMD